MGWTRRDFMRVMGGGALGSAAFRPFRMTGPAGGVAVLGSRDHPTPFGRGALLAMEEAGHSATLLRRDLELAWRTAPEAADADVLVDSLREEGFVAVVSALPPDAQEALERAAAEGGPVVVDARPRRPSTGDRAGPFRTGLPEDAFVGALRSAAERAGGEARAVLWDATLFRYGAQQLNDRFRRRFGAGMDGAAWASWMAVKAVAESLLRVPAAEPPALARALAAPRTAFDGHKGAPLAFDGPGRTLTQPLYVIGSRAVVEVQWPEEGT